MALLLAVLICAALVVKFWWLIAAVVSMFCAVHWTRRAVDRHTERVEVERRRLAGLVARADEQHAFVLAGDERGIYGEYPALPT